MAVHAAVENVDVYSSLTRVSITGGDHREYQGNRVSRLHGVLDRLGNRHGKGDVVVIRVNPSNKV